MGDSDKSFIPVKKSDYNNAILKRDAEIDHLKHQLNTLKKEYLDGPTLTEQKLVYKRIHKKKEKDMIKQAHKKMKQDIQILKQLENDRDFQLFQKVQELNKNKKEYELKKLYLADPNNSKHIYNLANFYLDNDIK